MFIVLLNGLFLCDIKYSKRNNHIQKKNIGIRNQNTNIPLRCVSYLYVPNTSARHI